MPGKLNRLADDDLVRIENEKPENIRLNRIKAIDVTIDSLKQYITLSTVFIGGLLAFFNGNGKNGDSTYLSYSVLAFVFCAITSVITINTFINHLHDSETNTRIRQLRNLNFGAILLFVAGILLGIFFLKSTETVAPEKKPCQLSHSLTDTTKKKVKR